MIKEIKNCIVCNDIIIDFEDNHICRSEKCKKIFKEISIKTLDKAKKESNLNSSYYWSEIKKLNNI